MAFEIVTESGETHHTEGGSTYLGSSFGHSNPTGYHEDGSFLVITYANGARRKIPLRLIACITED